MSITSFPSLFPGLTSDLNDQMSGYFCLDQRELALRTAQSLPFVELPIPRDRSKLDFSKQDLERSKDHRIVLYFHWTSAMADADAIDDWTVIAAARRQTMSSFRARLRRPQTLPTPL